MFPGSKFRPEGAVQGLHQSSSSKTYPAVIGVTMIREQNECHVLIWYVAEDGVAGLEGPRCQVIGGGIGAGGLRAGRSYAGRD